MKHWVILKKYCTNNISSLSTTVTDLNLQLNGNYIFIGDSYDNPEFGNWSSKTAQFMGLVKDKTYWSISLSGGSIAGGTFLSQIQKWCEKYPEKINTITYIICGGGINDSSPYAFSVLSDKLREFGNFCKDKFPNARVKLAYFGWALDTSEILYERSALYRYAAQILYTRAKNYNMEYLSGCEMVLHNRTLLDKDGLHPNSEGGTRIAEILANNLLGNSTNVTACVNEPIIVKPVLSNFNGSITQTLSGCQVYTSFYDVNFNACDYHFSSGAWTTLGDIKLTLSNKIPDTFCRLILNVKDRGNINCDCYLGIHNDQLLCKVFDIDPTTGTFYDIVVNEIHKFSINVIFNGLND